MQVLAIAGSLRTASADPELSGRLRRALDALRDAADPGRPGAATPAERSE